MLYTWSENLGECNRIHKVKTFILGTFENCVFELALVCCLEEPT